MANKCRQSKCYHQKYSSISMSAFCIQSFWSATEVNNPHCITFTDWVSFIQLPHSIDLLVTVVYSTSDHRLSVEFSVEGNCITIFTSYAQKSSVFVIFLRQAFVYCSNLSLNLFTFRDGNQAHIYTKMKHTCEQHVGKWTIQHFTFAFQTRFFDLTFFFFETWF